MVQYIRMHLWQFLIVVLLFIFALPKTSSKSSTVRSAVSDEALQKAGLIWYVERFTPIGCVGPEDMRHCTGTGETTEQEGAFLCKRMYMDHKLLTVVCE